MLLGRVPIYAFYYLPSHSTPTSSLWSQECIPIGERSTQSNSELSFPMQYSCSKNIGPEPEPNPFRMPFAANQKEKKGSKYMK